MPIIRKLSGLLFFVCFVLSYQEAFATQIVQSPNDHRTYKSLTLPNKLEVLLISDAKADKAAAALDINVGSGSDPKGYEGLSHFLEHMLFLGTEKYPEAGSYQDYINRHGGSHNAYTSFSNTNYFFDVNADALEPALDRFSQQFVAPTFTAKYVDREKNAVHSEFSSKLKDDSRLYFSAFKATINPEHPYHNFAVGNLSTLSDRDGQPIRDVLIDFYNTHYSANLMKLVVLGREPIPQLETWVTERFSRVPNSDAAKPEFKTPLFEEDALPALLMVEPIMDKRSLSLVFPIPSTQQQYHTKPTYYLSNLIGHEGKGSLFSLLKAQGLVESLSAGTGFDTGSEATFNLSYRLTQEGLKSWQQVVNLTFQYIDLLKSKGIDRLYFDEQKKMLELAFFFQEKSEPIHYVSSLASTLQEVQTEDVLQANYLMTSFDPKAYNDILEYLTPDNVLTSVMAKGLETDSKTEWYEAPYSYTKIPANQTLGSAHVEIADQLHLPEPNDFIPDNIEILSGTKMNTPEKLLSSEGFSLWHYFDNSFGTPKSNLYINLRSPHANDTAKHSVLTSLLVSMIQDELNEFTYPAYLAGLNYDLYSHIRGISIKVGGYSDKQNVLIAKILRTSKIMQLKRERFDIYKEQLVRSLENAAKKKPYQQTTDEIRKLVIKPQWTELEKLAALDNITLNDLSTFRELLLGELEIVTLSSGNISHAGSLNAATIIESWMFGNTTKRTSVKRAKVAQLPSDNSFAQFLKIDHPDTGYTLYIQGDDRSYQEQARFLLLAQLLSSPYYEKMRTENQLGYIVFATNFSFFEVPAIGFIIQSPIASGQQLELETQTFLSSYSQQLSKMPAKEFNQHKAALLSRLFEKDNSLAEKNDRFWREIDRENYSFDTREELAKEINKLTPETFLGFYQALVKSQGKKLLVYSHGNNLQNKDTSISHPNTLKPYDSLISGDDLWSLKTPFNDLKIRDN